MDYLSVGLENLGGGAAVEKFNDCLQQVFDNILDPNTATAARTVTLKVTIKPNEKRTVCSATVACEARLLPPKPFLTEILVGHDGKQAVASEHDPDRESIPSPPGKTLKMERVKREGE